MHVSRPAAPAVFQPPPTRASVAHNSAARQAETFLQGPMPQQPTSCASPAWGSAPSVPWTQAEPVGAAAPPSAALRQPQAAEQPFGAQPPFSVSGMSTGSAPVPSMMETPMPPRRTNTDGGGCPDEALFPPRDAYASEHMHVAAPTQPPCGASMAHNVAACQAETFLQGPMPQQPTSCASPAWSSAASASWTQAHLLAEQPAHRWQIRSASRADDRLRKACHHRNMADLDAALQQGGGMGGDGDGKSALHVAARSGFCEGLLKLLQAGFDPNLRDKWGGRPIDEAEYWAVKTDDADFRRKCLDCRKHLVLFHGRRGELHERVDLAAFKERLRRCEERARQRDGREAYIPWFDDLDHMEQQLKAEELCAEPESPSASAVSAAAPTWISTLRYKQDLPSDPERLRFHPEISEEYQRQAATRHIYREEETLRKLARLAEIGGELLDPKHEVVYL
ncbi:per1 [Symbiodinium sp. CCMP2592]|nr:per1 [Symbiodinium sp. CCMP2592]